MADETSNDGAPAVEQIHLRAISARVPFRRGGLAFAEGSATVSVPRSEVTEAMVIALLNDPATSIEISQDGGKSWSGVSSLDEAAEVLFDKPARAGTVRKAAATK